MSSFSISRDDIGIYFSPKSNKECESETLQCICDEDDLNLKFNFGLFEYGAARKISKEIKMNPSPKGCYEFGLLSEGKLFKDS